MSKRRLLQISFTKGKAIMRKEILYLILLIFVIIFIGCESVSNYEACLNDPVCVTEIQNIQNGVTTSATTTLSSVPSTNAVSMTVGSIIGGIVAFLVGINKGKKIRKDK